LLAALAGASRTIERAAIQVRLQSLLFIVTSVQALLVRVFCKNVSLNQEKIKTALIALWGTNKENSFRLLETIREQSGAF
ncbi:MAG TPA: hypothetical protein VFB70_07690, partial [Pyrinomonadaceae bacterium]|nr:hypothetical protein [Pyrinomonadaceae bacterium]